MRPGRLSLGSLLLSLLVVAAAPTAQAGSRRVKVFPVPTADSRPTGIAAGPDGALWFTENSANQIGRITPQGSVTEFPIPTAGSRPTAIAAGPDGAMWFTENVAGQIGRISVDGDVTDEFPLPPGASFPIAIAAGPDGNMWFTAADSIGRITLKGDITNFPLPPETSAVRIASWPARTEPCGSPSCTATESCGSPPTG